MADIAHDLTDEKLAKMERHLSAIYRRASAELQKTADDFFEKHKKEDAKKAKLVADGKLSASDYEKWQKNEILHSKRFEDMQRNYARKLANINQIAIEYVNGELPEIYTLNYNAMSQYDGIVDGYSFDIVNEKAVEYLAKTEESLLPYKKLDLKKDVAWNMKKINSEVLQGILQGESIPNIAKRMKNVEHMSEVSAIRTARTSVTGAENKGRDDSYKKAEEDGLMILREWVATEDKRTRDSHAAMNGKKRKIGVRFPNGLLYPGDPTGVPAEVYNCRCRIVANVIGYNGKKFV